MDILIVRLSAPLLSFGGALIDHFGPIRSHPACSMITGLLGNALGFDHSESRKLQTLQNRLHFAVRCDFQGEKIRDYQTVDFGQDFFQQTGWRTCGSSQNRFGGESRNGTHIRYRDYWAGAIYTLAITLDPQGEEPNLESLARALKEPKRPLFIGRKHCIPSEFIFQGILKADSLLDALIQTPLSQLTENSSEDRSFVKIWIENNGEAGSIDNIVPITDERDWANQIHAGRRLIIEKTIPVTQIRGRTNEE